MNPKKKNTSFSPSNRQRPKSLLYCMCVLLQKWDDGIASPFTLLHLPRSAVTITMIRWIIQQNLPYIFR